MPQTIKNILALFTQAKAFVDNPVIGNQLLNRMGLHVTRVVLAHAIIRLRQYWVLATRWRYINREDRICWFENGYIAKRGILTQRQLQEIRDEFERERHSLGESFQGDTATASVLLTQEHLARLPGTRGLLDNKSLTALLNFCSGMFLRPWFYFLAIRNGVRDNTVDPTGLDAAGKVPTAELQKAPTAGLQKVPTADPQKVPHADAFHPTMKAWLFLYDVDTNAGPFTYYPGSHKLSWRRLCWEYHRSVHFRDYMDGYSERGSFRLTTKDYQTLAIGEPEVFAVPANTLVIANTYGFHCRGAAETGTERKSVWISAWRAPFLPIPLPNLPALRRLFERRMQSSIGKRVG